MAYIMTYTSLLEDVRRYLERGFTLESDRNVFLQLPRLVALAERRIATELKIQGFIDVVSTQLVPGQSVYDKPDRWRDTVSLTVDNSALLPRSYEYLRTYWPDPAETGAPRFYADYDYFHWLIVPTPATAQTFEVMYYQLPALLDEQNQTNWLTAFAPNLLLYATLLESAPFLKNDARVATWQAMYDRAAEATAGQDLQKILDRSTQRSDA